MILNMYICNQKSNNKNMAFYQHFVHIMRIHYLIYVYIILFDFICVFRKLFVFC